jgi:hypothetical protein
MQTILARLRIAGPVLADAPQVHRDNAYAEPKNQHQTFNVYAPKQGKNHRLSSGFTRAAGRRATRPKPRHDQRLSGQTGRLAATPRSTGPTKYRR